MVVNHNTNKIDRQGAIPTAAAAATATATATATAAQATFAIGHSPTQLHLGASPAHRRSDKFALALDLVLV